MNTHNFIEEYKLPIRVCDNLLKYYQKNTEYKFNRTDLKDTTEVHFFNDSNDETIKYFFNELVLCVTNYVNKYKIQNSIKTNKTNKIQHYKSKTGFLTLHSERTKEYPTRELVYMLYLNTVKDGGGTEFPFLLKKEVLLYGLQDLLILIRELFLLQKKNILLQVGLISYEFI